VVTFSEALAQMLAAVRRLPAESISLNEALGRILAADVLSDVDVPPFDKAAMDGYACRKQDLATGWLDVIEETPAGAWPRETVRPGTCLRILTGAPMPQGADCVIMQEQTERHGPRLRIHRADTPSNLSRQAEDVHRGDCVLHAGDILTPAHLAVLATVGCVRPQVARRPRVTVLVTGNELVGPHCRPEGAQVRDSNGPQLHAQLARIGVVARYEGIVRDDLVQLVERIGQAKPGSDLVLVSGGASAGDYDFASEAFRRCGYRLLFERVAMQPGKPTIFGLDRESFCCGLPGNPVSAFVAFELLLRPFLDAMMGRRESPRTIPATLAQAFRRHKADRQCTLPVRLDEAGRVTPVEYHGSAHILAISQADALLTVPAGVSELEEGTVVRVRPL